MMLLQLYRHKVIGSDDLKLLARLGIVMTARRMERIDTSYAGNFEAILDARRTRERIQSVITPDERIVVLGVLADRPWHEIGYGRRRGRELLSSALAKMHGALSAEAA